MKGKSRKFLAVTLCIWLAACGGASPSRDVFGDDGTGSADGAPDADGAADVPAAHDPDIFSLTWEPVPPQGEIWEPRAGFGALVHGGRLWVLGGMAAHDGRPVALDDVWATSDGRTWELIKPADGSAWHPRANFAVVSAFGRMWLMGGNWDDAGVPEYESDVWSSSDGVHWEKVLDSHYPATETAWGDRKGLSAAFFDGRLWVLAGADTDALSDVWSSENGAQWTRTADGGAWGPRAHACVAVHAGRLWIAGGQKGYTPQAWDDAWSSSDGVRWELSGKMPDVVYGHACVASPEGVWVLGGQGGNAPRNRVWFSADGSAWTATESVFPERWYHQAVLFQDALWVLGGAAQQGMGLALLCDVWRAPLSAAAQQVRNAAR